MARCDDRVHDVDGTRFRCQLPRGHSGWHLDTFRLVDAGELRLRCELRWDQHRLALDDLIDELPGAAVRRRG